MQVFIVGDKSVLKYNYLELNGFIYALEKDKSYKFKIFRRYC